ncbi:MAG: hypothetical protein IK080_07885 [Clostridia bacterium]|nr:hypothetical protein [Clostridia bacterium]
MFHDVLLPAKIAILFIITGNRGEIKSYFSFFVTKRRKNEGKRGSRGERIRVIAKKQRPPSETGGRCRKNAKRLIS